MSLFCFHMYYSGQKLYESKVVKTLSYSVRLFNHSSLQPESQKSYSF